MFDKITIVGLGLIGGSMAAAFKRKHVEAEITGVDRREIVETAVRKGFIDNGHSSDALATALEGADLVVLATPIQSILQLLSQIAPLLKTGCLVTDVGSTKRTIVHRAAHVFPSGAHFAGGHPMTGSEARGIAAADPFLFENAYYVLTENDLVPEILQRKLVRLLETIGARVLFLPADVHDELAAAVSHLPQVLAISLMHYAAAENEKNPMYLKLAAGGFRDMTRIASSPYAVWEHIFKTNKDNVCRAIDEFMKHLGEVRKKLETDALEGVFEKAGRDRLSIPKDTRGFLNPHFDVSVVVEDKPGVLASITGILAEAEINIKDIEILKVREGDAGTLRMAFASQAERGRAVAHLAQNGFVVTERD